MQLIRQGTKWVALSAYSEKDLAKSAGFRWDPTAKQWWTNDTQIACKLGRYANETCRTALRDAQAAAQEAIKASQASDADVDMPVPEGRALLPFQRAGCKYILDRIKDNGILLSDEMGLGKSVQAIAVLNYLQPERTLIICPAGLKLVWRNFLRDWLTLDQSVGIAVSNDLPETDIVIVNYDIVKRHADALRTTTWGLLICDEAHMLKGGTKTQRGAYVLGNKDVTPIPATYKLFLTGTPLVNRPKELYPLINALDPTKWTKFFPFALRYCAASQDKWGWNFDGASNLDELQQILRSRCMVRRRKTEVLTELPPKTRAIIEVSPNGAQSFVDAEREAWDRSEDAIATLRTAAELAKAEGEEQYKAAVDRLSEAARAAFTEMAKLRHDTALAKVPAVIDHIETMLAETPKLVCFAWHHDVINTIVKAFPGSVHLTGADSMTTRQEAVERFQTDPTCHLFVGNIQAAGVGITLTAASHVVFAELDWVPGNMTQAEDRCYRLGTVNPVLIQHLVLDGSLDARMAKVLVAKQEVLDAALDKETIKEEIALPDPPATENTKSAELAAIALTLKPEVIQAVHEGLQILAGLCDGARSLDDIGFNKIDAGIGRSLAMRERLTAKQAALGRKIIWKYKRQLPDYINTTIHS